MRYPVVRNRVQILQTEIVRLEDVQLLADLREYEAAQSFGLRDTKISQNFILFSETFPSPAPE